MKTNPTAHNYRVMQIKTWFLILIGFILFMATACRSQYGCASTSGKNYKIGYHPNK